MPKQKLSHGIVTDYLRRIAFQELTEGELLPTEAVMAEQFSVSRTAIREALQTLATKGFIQIRQGSGSTIAPRWRWNVLDPDYLAITAMGPSLMRDLIEARKVLEPEIAALAAQRADEDQIRRLRELNGQLVGSNGRSPENHADIDIAFHALLAECTGNPVLISLHASIVELGRRQRTLMARVPGAIDRAASWHEYILDAISAHDADAGRDAMRMHMRQVHGEMEDLEADLAAGTTP